MTEILPRSADVLWELAKEKKKSKGAGRDETSTGITNNRVTYDPIGTGNTLVLSWNEGTR